MTAALRMALLVIATALMTGAIFAAARSSLATGLLFFFLAFLCVVFAMMAGKQE